MFFKVFRELFFLLLVLYLTTNLLNNWTSYSPCFAPIHSFLLTVYTFIFLSRAIRVFVKARLTFFLYRIFYPVLAIITLQGIIYQILNNTFAPTCGSGSGYAVSGQVWSAIILLMLANAGTLAKAVGDYVLGFLYKIFEMRMESVIMEVNAIMSTQEILLSNGYRSESKGFRGLSIEEIAKIQKKLISSLLEQDKYRQETCSVCYEDFKNGEDMSVLPGCNHMYHTSCVKVWLAKCPVCPMCRSNVRTNLEAEQQAVSQV